MGSRFPTFPPIAGQGEPEDDTTRVTGLASSGNRTAPGDPATNISHVQRFASIGDSSTRYGRIPEDSDSVIDAGPTSSRSSESWTPTHPRPSEAPNRSRLNAWMRLSYKPTNKDDGASQVISYHGPYSRGGTPTSSTPLLSDASHNTQPPELRRTSANQAPEHITPTHRVLKSSGRDASSGPLQKQLFKAMQENKTYDNWRGFLPKQQLNKIMNLQAVERQLMRSESRLPRFLHKFMKVDERRVLRKFIHVDEEQIRLDARRICGVTEPAQVNPATSTDSGRPIPPPKVYLKVFATLLLIERSCNIQAFLNEGLHDADLPLIKVHAASQFGPWVLRRKTAPETPLKCFEGWEHNIVDKFEDWQWTVLAPSLVLAESRELQHIQLETSEVLPFTYKGAESRNGGFGKVFEVKIHPDHLHFQNKDACNRSFAVKMLKSRHGTDIENEVAILKRFSNNEPQHLHLVSLLGTYEQHGVFNLVFPWAQADLFLFWSQVYPEGPGFDSGKTLEWLVRQCQGLAEGLSQVHRYHTHSKTLLHPTSFPHATKVPRSTPEGAVRDFFRLFGRHGDVKPENVLWFPPPSGACEEYQGILKLTDFGNAEFRAREHVQGRKHGVSPTYRPPESDVCRDGAIISGAYDIWSLGCVYLEFLGWWFDGWASVEAFGRDRQALDPEWWRQDGLKLKSDRFFITEDTGNGGARTKVKTQVKEFMRKLLDRSTCTDLSRAFLNMIRDHMLVVLVESPSPSTQKTGRWGAKDIADELAKILSAS